MPTTTEELTIDIDTDKDYTSSSGEYRLALDPDERRVYVRHVHEAHGRNLGFYHSLYYDDRGLPAGVDGEKLVEEIEQRADALNRICDLHSTRWSERAGQRVGVLDTDRFGSSYVREVLAAIGLAASGSRYHKREPMDFHDLLERRRKTCRPGVDIPGLQEQYL